MTRRRLLALLLIAAVAAGVAAFVLARRGDGLLDATRKRIAALDTRERRESSEWAVAAYVPKVRGSLADLDDPAEPLLRQLPGVAEVETLVTSARPAHRIVHLRDYHLVPPPLFDAEARHVHGRDLTQEELAALYTEHVYRVELVQLDLAGVLTCLARHHGVRRVLCEGLVEGEAAAYRRGAVELYKAGVAIRQQLADVRGERDRADPGSDRHKEALALVDNALGLLSKNWFDGIRWGAAALPLGAGELDAVLPLDDGALLDRGKPDTGGGIDAAANREREDAQVKVALASGPVAVIVLGGGHDLSDAVRRVGGGTVEYLRITTRHYAEADRAR